jgi:hypothetical protein
MLARSSGELRPWLSDEAAERYDHAPLGWNRVSRRAHQPRRIPTEGPNRMTPSASPVTA